mmetsp:Transcript_1990/g.7194  ORF Transcript_1990/g.7194 Transcript_1990/m.7194 type:complete len:252 (-) Transcript_1990:35-790(-)
MESVLSLSRSLLGDEGSEMFWGPAVVHFSCYWLCSALALAADLYYHFNGKLKEVKLQPKQVHMTTNWRLYAYTAFYVLRNQLLITGPMGIPYVILLQWRGVAPSAPYPSWPVMILQFLGILFVEEMLFFYAHWMLHHRAIYRYVHKVHHLWKMPVGVAALYAHPVEHLLANILPSYIGGLLVGAHYHVMLVWTAVASINVVKAHCGYPRGSVTHDDHHQWFNCNYGNFDWFDRVHGTRLVDVYPSRVREAA